MGALKPLTIYEYLLKLAMVNLIFLSNDDKPTSYEKQSFMCTSYVKKNFYWRFKMASNWLLEVVLCTTVDYFDMFTAGFSIMYFYTSNIPE